MELTAELFLELRHDLGEGPLWHARTGRLYWVDITAGEVHALEHATGRRRTATVGAPAGTVVPTRRSEVLIALGQRCAFLDLEHGRLAPFPVDPLVPAHCRLNDGKCDPAGRFWVGSMAFSEEPGHGSLFCIHGDLRIETKLTGLGISNGLAWSRDGATLYYVDSLAGSVDRFDFDPASGAIANRRVLRTYAPADGFPDGITLDADGFVWVALWDGGRVERLHPDDGRTVLTVRVPARRVTACAFGGPGLDTLFITTARAGLSAGQLAAQPLAGSLFAVRPGGRGVEAAEFAG